MIVILLADLPEYCCQKYNSCRTHNIKNYIC